MAQFTCSICGDGFEQKSRLERHLATSHPPQAPSCSRYAKSIIWNTISKVKARFGAVCFTKVSIVGQDLFDLIKSLPSRTYRDSADVAVALGELKSGKKIRSEREIVAVEQPSKKGGRPAATSSISATSIAKVLSGIDFPKRKNSLKNYAKKNISNS